jgi:hypothetical protein
VRKITFDIGFAALGLYYPSASFATVYCKDNSPHTPCTRFSGTTCPPSTKPAYTTKCSLTGGSTGTGSEWTIINKVGDDGGGLAVEFGDPPIPDKLKSVCGNGFIDFTEDTVQVADCTYTPDSGPNAGEPQEAQCFLSDLVCPCNKVGACIGGERESVAICPTLIGGVNVAGCTGKLEVHDLNGNTIRGPGGSDGGTIQIGAGIAGLTNNGSCQKIYPKASGFAKNVASKVIQQCTTPDDGSNLDIVFGNPIVEYALRSTNKFRSDGQLSALNSATCNPVDGYPSGACTNDWGGHLTFLPANGDQCNKNNFRCGQDPTGAFGPAPDRCTFDQSSGLCTCRCNRCNKAGTLVNLGLFDQGLFFMTSTTSDNSYACDVRVTGN